MFRVECVSCGHNVDLILLRKLRLDSYLHLKIPFVHSLWLGCTHSSLKKWQWTTLLRSIFYYILLASIKYVGHFTASLCCPRPPHTHTGIDIVLSVVYASLHKQCLTVWDTACLSHTQQFVIIIITVIIVHLVCESHFLGSKCRMTFIKQAENVELTLMPIFTLFACWLV